MKAHVCVSNTWYVAVYNCVQLKYNGPKYWRVDSLTTQSTMD